MFVVKNNSKVSRQFMFAISVVFILRESVKTMVLNLFSTQHELTYCLIKTAVFISYTRLSLTLQFILNRKQLNEIAVYSVMMLWLVAALYMCRLR